MDLFGWAGLAAEFDKGSSNPVVLHLAWRTSIIFPVCTDKILAVRIASFLSRLFHTAYFPFKDFLRIIHSVALLESATGSTIFSGKTGTAFTWTTAATKGRT